MAVLIATSPRPSLRGRLRRVAALGALGCATVLAVDLGASAQQTACNIGKACTIDVTGVVGFPGLGTATQVVPVEVDLTEFNADGNGKVKVGVPGAESTYDIENKKVKSSKVKRKKGEPVTKFKRDKATKAGVKVKAAKPR